MSPAADEKDVVLGSQIVVTFNQEIDPTTVNESTFSLTGPGQTQILTTEQMIASEPDTLTGREYIAGTFVFELDGLGRTVVRFNPSKPLRKDLKYTVLLLGANASLSADAIRNLAGDAMVESYEWSFTAGSLNTTTPPLPAPLPEAVPYIDPTQIVVLPRQVVGSDLAQNVIIIFPDDIDPDSFKLEDILVSVEAVLGDPSVSVPSNLTASPRIDGRKLIITITGWES